MFFLLVQGRRTRGRALGQRSAFCGHCLGKSLQDVVEIEETRHVYFVDVWSGGRRVLARCHACGGVMPAVRRGESGASEATQCIDAFLDASAPELLRAGKGNAVTALGSVLGFAGFVALGAVAMELGDLQPGYPVGIAIFVAALALVVVLVRASYARAQPAVVRAVFASVIEARLRNAIARTGESAARIAERARAIGYADLAAQLDAPRFRALSAPAA